METENKSALKIFKRTERQRSVDNTTEMTPSPVGDSSIQRSGFAALEVDRFAWPPLCQALDNTSKTVATPIVEAIVRASITDKKIVLISSGARRSGRTITAIWLAATCARNNLRIALMDADVENPSITRMLGIQPRLGWETFSSQHAPLSEYVVDSLSDRYAVLPLIRSEPLKKWSPKWDLSTVLEDLRDHYDAVLVDTPPLVRHGIALEMLDHCAPFVDAALWLDTGPIETRRALQQFQAMGIHSLGLLQRAAFAAVAA